MRQNQAILDIGSSKILCFICGADGDGMHVVGAGISEYSGLRHGAFLEEKKLRQTVMEAVGTAENEARRRIRSLAVGVPAPFLTLYLASGETELSRPGKKVADADVERVLNASLEFPQPEGYTLISSTPYSMSLVRSQVEDAPKGVAVTHLHAEVSHILMRNSFRDTVTEALERLDIETEMFVGTPLAEGLFVIPAAERRKRAVLIDIGAYHTEVSLLTGAALIGCRVIEMGGWHFASDLAYGLNIPLSAAENLKRGYTFSPHCQDSMDVIKYPDGSVTTVVHGSVQYIIEARSDELIQQICWALQELGITRDDPVPIYLTGGGAALMRGFCEYMERCLGLSIQVRMPWMPRLSAPNYASGFSLMDFVMKETEAVPEDRRPDRDNKTIRKNFFTK